MLKLLKTHFGYDSFRPLQEEIINRVLNGDDAFVLMPTGGGKSLCFQLPALKFSGLTIVVSPLIALMKDQVDSLIANGIPAAFINSSLSAYDLDATMKSASSGDLKILYLAPERLASYGFSDFLDSLNVSLLAIDEAHCISEWGHDFRPDYRNLKSLRSQFKDTPVIALTATATPQVRKDILNQLEMSADSTFVSSFNRENLHYSVKSKINSTAQLVALLKPRKGESAIVYCFSRKNTEEIANALVGAGLNAAPYHAGLAKDIRMETQEKFIRDEVPIIVATIAFGMGIDKPDVRLVVHMDLPKTIEGYYQETGRAGRDGLPGECILYYTHADKRKQEYFINQINNPSEKKLATKKLNDVILYCQSSGCRRVELLRYFGEAYSESSCNNCDNCVVSNVEMVDSTVVAQKIMSAVLRTNERFGAVHITDVLRGSRKKKILELGHDNLSVHGIMQDTPAAAVRAYIEAMRKLGYLNQNDGDYPTLSVGEKGKLALSNGEKIDLPKLDTVEMAPKRNSRSDLDYNNATFEALRVLRKKLADERGVPPFVIFGDRSLYEMAYYLPSSLEAFSQLFGVGKQKLEEFGEDFLKTIAEHVKEQGLEEKQPPVKNSRQLSGKSGRSNTVSETRLLLEEGLSIDEIATARTLAQGTIIAHIEKLTFSDDSPDIAHLKPKEKEFVAIKEAFEASKSASLTFIYKKLDEKYTYDELRLARLFL